MSKTRKNSRELYQKLIHEYQRAHGGEPYSMQDVAAWGLKTGKISPPRPVDIIQAAARELRKAARDEYFTDPQGRRVRRNHARREKVVVDGEEQQATFWDDIRTAKPEHMRVSFQQRRQGIVWDAFQHKTDTDSYNDNNKHGAQLAFDYDMNKDIHELEQAGDYPDQRPGDGAEDEPDNPEDDE